MKILNRFEINVSDYGTMQNFCELHKLEMGRWHRNWFVYVMCLDASMDGEKIIPLYVGKTSNIKTRITQHQSKAWFKYVDFILIEEFPEHRLAQHLESDLIEKTRPVFNLQVSKRKKAKKHLPKLAAVHNIFALMYEPSFNGDDMYDWVTQELPLIQPMGL